MLRLRCQGLLLLAIALLFPIGASMPIACCAGVAAGAHAATPASSHCGGGASCCERASEDAAARHCCQGGDAFERPQPGPQWQPALATVPSGLELLAPLHTADGSPQRSARDPVPRVEPLYTLHSSLLI
jgi:hypothetical protein